MPAHQSRSTTPTRSPASQAETGDGALPRPLPLRSPSVLDLPTVPELEDCIRCGLCLSVCPTYRPTGVEGDSPRGRVALVKAQVEGKVDPETPAFQQHMDLCLQCMACASVCPTDVNAGAIVARQKAYMHATRPRSPWQRLLYHLIFRGLFPHYGRLELVTFPLALYRRSGLQRLVRRGGLLQRLPGPLWLMEALLPERLGPPARRRIPALTPPHGARRARVAFHLCCINNVMFPDASVASVRVLARNGAEVVMPREVTCCGAPHETEGEMELGRALARRNIALYERLGVDYVITDAAACGAVLKHYGHWLAHDRAWRERAERFAAKVRDIHEFLVAVGVETPPAVPPVPPAGQELPGPSGSPSGQAEAAWRDGTAERARRPRVTYDDPCHLCHAQGISKQPRELLKRIPGIEYVELPEASWCCGSAGTYNITQPEMAETILKDKIAHIRETGADVIASANPGCMLQLEAGLRRYGVKGTVRHVTELLDEAYAMVAAL